MPEEARPRRPIETPSPRSFWLGITSGVASHGDVLRTIEPPATPEGAVSDNDAVHCPKSVTLLPFVGLLAVGLLRLVMELRKVGVPPPEPAGGGDFAASWPTRRAQSVGADDLAEGGGRPLLLLCGDAAELCGEFPGEAPSSGGQRHKYFFGDIERTCCRKSGEYPIACSMPGPLVIAPRVRGRPTGLTGSSEPSFHVRDATAPLPLRMCIVSGDCCLLPGDLPCSARERGLSGSSASVGQAIDSTMPLPLRMLCVRGDCCRLRGDVAVTDDPEAWPIASLTPSLLWSLCEAVGDEARGDQADCEAA